MDGRGEPGRRPRRVHYLCDEGAGWLPDLDDIRAKITPNTRAIVVINPNNPDGRAVSGRPAARDLSRSRARTSSIVFADEIYDKMLYDGAQHTSIASLADDVLFVTFNGLSKNYRACGYRSGWMVISGEKRHARGLHRGPQHPRLDAPVRQRAGPVRDPDGAAAATRASTTSSTPGGRLARQRDLAYDLITSIPGRDLREAEGGAVPVPAPRSRSCYPIEDDQQFILELLEEEKVLVVRAPASTGRARSLPPRVPARTATISPKRSGRIAPISSMAIADANRATSMKPHQRRPARLRHRRPRHVGRPAPQRGGDRAPRGPADPRQLDRDAHARPRARRHARRRRRQPDQRSRRGGAAIPTSTSSCELIGGIEPRARSCSTRSRTASTWSPPTRRCSRMHGNEIFAAASRARA